ncbi:Acyl-n-acyltransferase [Lasiodiplodia theobromae]|uniref:Acyl-n-acyltransferase n=1 Tax=Lasiodiplodia theobromae TaxID=45133 RepID=UPI0015C40843|nr:Acyl-n-acyltransferase [Lasiodiplodia theobromae]KAF4535852.1 Acyl-n-acyltransferase [Lasiodiplodia theobromae]
MISPSTRQQGAQEYAIRPVSPVQDAADLAGTMVRAFYQDPHWASLWKNITLDEIIYDCERRLPRNLIGDLGIKRHQKAVDMATGKAVGYARWILPEGAADEERWADAAVPAVDDSTRRQFEQLFDSVTHDGGKIRHLNEAMVGELSIAIEVAEERVRRGDAEFLRSMLLRSGLAYADEKRLKVLVVAKTPGVKLYEDHGFCIVEVVEQERPQYGWSTPYRTTILVRQPKAMV